MPMGVYPRKPECEARRLAAIWHSYAHPEARVKKVPPMKKGSPELNQHLREKMLEYYATHDNPNKGRVRSAHEPKPPRTKHTRGVKPGFKQSWEHKARRFGWIDVDAHAF
jgi:hypothetical protein